MSDFINRKALRNALYEADAVTMKGVEIINTFPTVEPKKGKWEGDGQCSECLEYPLGRYASYKNFCPNCGADMKGETDDDNHKKKQFEEALAKARKEAAEEVYTQCSRNETNRENERNLNERFNYIDRCMDKAFADIDRRIGELESKYESKSRRDEPVCFRY